MEEQVLVSKDAQRIYQQQLSSPGGPQADQQSEAAADEAPEIETAGEDLPIDQQELPVKEAVTT
eukprot:11137421-Prorocentrum_lima.AAC.1